MNACNYIDSTLLALPCPMLPLTLSQYSPCSVRWSNSRSSVGHKLPAPDSSAQSRDAATACGLSHLSPRSPYAITRESMSLHSRYRSSETPSASKMSLRTRSSVPAPAPAPLKTHATPAHDSHFLVVQVLRKPRSDPSLHPPVREPVYPEQRHVAQRPYLRAVSSKFVPVNGVQIGHVSTIERRDGVVPSRLGRATIVVVRGGQAPCRGW